MSNLDHYLTDSTDEVTRGVIVALGSAACKIMQHIRFPRSSLDAEVGAANAGGDAQKALDVLADEIILDALGESGSRAYLSEERDHAVPVNEGGGVLVACDPLDGSSNIGVNMPVGTIFSILPAEGGELVAGREQIAAGFFVYGPQTTLLLTVGRGVASFRMNQKGGFEKIEDGVSIPAETNEFAINASYARHWFSPIRNYIDECLEGKSGARAKDYNMRWAGSLVADAWRVFERGGIFLYPGDQRDGCDKGRLRHVYEAAPVAFLVEQAGGLASDGKQPIMDVLPGELHARTPLVFGSREEVQRVMDLHREG